MKKFLLLVSVVFSSLVFAEENRSMYIFGTDGMIYSYPVSAIDSIMFDQPETGINIAPKSITLRKGESCVVNAQTIGFTPTDDGLSWIIGDENIVRWYEAQNSFHSAGSKEILGLRVGTTTLTVKGSGYQSSINVEVLPFAESEAITSENVDYLMNLAYEDLIWIHDHWGYWGYCELTTDECVAPTRYGGDWNDGGYWRNLHNHTLTGSQLEETIFGTNMSGINQCSRAIDNISNSTLNAKLKASKVNELLALRCYYYYMLFDCFGSVPYIDGEYVADEIGTRFSSDQLWSKLVTTLEEVAPTLPKVTDSTREQYIGRVTQGLAYSLLARLYLNAESFGCTPSNISLPNTINLVTTQDFYDNALRCCDQVINSGSYSIEDDYFANFKIHNENSKENIFVLVEDGLQRGIKDKFWAHSKFRFHFLTLPYAMETAWNMLERPWNGLCATESFINRFEYGKDLRGACDSTKGTDACHGYGWFLGAVKKNGVVLKDDYYDQNDIIISAHIESIENASRNAGARMIKYEIDTTGTYWYMENDFVLFRYADVLYMKAEAILRGANGNINDLLNYAPFRKIRQRAGVDYFQSLTLNELLDERGREFYWEGLRRRDLIRFGRYNDSTYIDFLTNVDSSNNNIPLPNTAIASTIHQDGMYTIPINATSADSLLLMGQGINERDYQKREGLYEKYIYLHAGEQFTIAKIDGKNYECLGANLKKCQLETDNMPLDGYSGDYQYYGSNKEKLMQVDEDGLYLVACDEKLNKVIVCPVNWGIAGAMNYWGYTAADQTLISEDEQSIEWVWTNVAVENSNCEFKFKQDGAWKIFLDEGVSINLSIPNSDFSSIAIPEMGIYDIHLTYHLASGEMEKSYSYTVTKVGDLDYSNCQMELVGAAVADQVGASPDLTWYWGNVFPMGKPVKEGDVYTWKVEGVHMVVGEFKVRTVNFEAQGYVAAFDNGSYQNITYESDYDITFTLNAETNEKNVVIEGGVPPVSQVITVNAKMPSNWTETPTAWIWPDGGDGEAVALTQNGEWWSYTTPKAVAGLNIIFRNGADWSGDANQTVDLHASENTCWELAQEGAAKATVTIVECSK